VTKKSDTVELDPSQPFERVLIEMLELHRKKRADYAIDGDALWNFYRTAQIMEEKGWRGLNALASADFLLAVKQARMEALRANGRTEQTANEPVRDTLIDDANYAVLKLAIYDRLNGIGQ